jgi:hypothetical protein
MVFKIGRSKFKPTLKKPPISIQKSKANLEVFLKKNCTTVIYNMACPCIGFTLEDYPLGNLILMFLKLTNEFF